MTIALLSILFTISYCIGAVMFFARGDLYRKIFKPSMWQKKLGVSLRMLAALSSTFAGTFLITRSVNISLPISLILSYLPVIFRRNKARKEEESRRKSWPLVIDQLSTATASGVSLPLALVATGSRGPSALQHEFTSFAKSFNNSGSLAIALNEFVHAATERGSRSHSRMAAQLKSTILIARDCGGLEIGPILRNLSMHLRHRERALDEIAVRQNWIKNGAALASLTPWLLLLVLSLHSQTIMAYNSDAGRLVLLSRLLMTGLAYRWIARISESVSTERR